MVHSERHEELVALRALGSVGDGEQELDAHLAEGCPTCELQLNELRASAAALAFGVPSRRPGPAARARLLSSLGPVAAPAIAGEERAAPRKIPWWLVAAAAVVLLFLIADYTRVYVQRDRLHEELAGTRSQLQVAEREAARQSQATQGAADLAARLRDAEAELSRRDLRARVLDSDDVRILFLGGKDPQPGARAKVYWSERAKRGILVAGNLQPLPPDQQYQLWVFEKGKPVDAGVFDVDAEGRALFESRDLSAISGAENFAVTIEPRGGMPQPTGPIVLVGAPTAG